MACEIKYNTLLDLARQAKIITGNTACFDGKIEAGLPFSGYPSGVDTSTIVSLGIVGSSESAVLSGNNLTTLFDVSNPLSPNYNVVFDIYSGITWSNPLFSANTSGLTLPITPISATTQIVGPIWTATQTGMTGDYVIDTQYTGYTITYSPFNVVGDLSGGTGTTYSAVTGFTSAIQENFSAGTLDYKGPLDYISSIEDATVDGRLTTKKLTVTDGASASTIGYVLTQLDSSGNAGWVFNSSSASTNTFVTGGTLNGTNLDLTWNTGGSVPSIDFSSLSGGTFTGNTSGDCITDLWLTNLHSCSPLFINPLDEGNVYFGSNSGVTIDLLNGGEMLVKGDAITHSDTNPTSPLNGVAKGQYTEFNWSGITGGIVSNNSTSGVSSYYVGDFSNFPTTRKHGSIRYYGSGYTRSGGATTVASSFYQNKVLIAGGADVDGMVIKPKTGDASGTLWFEVNGSSVAQLYSDSGYFGLGLNPDGTELPTAHLQVGGTGTTGTFKFLDGNEQSGYVLTSDANGVGSWQASAGGGGATIDPYQDEGNVTSITWDVSGTSTNYEATLTGVTTLTMSNVRNGDYGTLIVTQDGTGSRTLSFVGGTHKVVNGGGGAPTLTTTAGATDILSFTYNGTNFYWTVGNDYT